jgi:sodium-dependent dicarboxylate transporter 2/3/5
MSKVLLVDDEASFREPLAQRLELRGIATAEAGDGEQAIKLIRADSEIDVILLDRKMPGMSGEQVLQEMKRFRPELQVIMLTAHGSLESAMETGRLDAYAYLQKPCDLEELVSTIERAREDKVHAMTRHEIPNVPRGSVWVWLKGSHNSRPGIILLGLAIFLAIALAPAPSSMVSLVSAVKTGEMTDKNLGYSDYAGMKPGDTIADYYSRKYKLGKTETDASGKKTLKPMTVEQVCFKARVMLAILATAALFWATGAVPVGITALMVGVFMYFTGVLRPDDIAKAYAKDAVIFIFGVLAISSAITKTGLDRRIGLLLLAPATSRPRLLFFFLPMMGVACSFVSEHALIAFVMPLMMMVYLSSVRAAGVKKDKALAVMLVLSMSFAANCGGPGSPAAGGRNAVMLSILSDYGNAPSFAQWVKYGLPYVPVMAIVIALYFLIVFHRKIAVKKLNVSAHVKQASNKIGPMNRNEYITAIALVVLILLWITSSDKYGMGGPVILCLVALNVLRVLRWKDIANIPWDVVALYASAAALGKGLAVSGAAVFLADSFVQILPDFMRSGEGLAIAVSLFTGVTTNFMSDGATVSAIGPITIPMATISGTHPWMVGFATAFASSFAHMTVIGTPNNAIAYAIAKDPVTGEQLVTLSDFLKHGFAVLILSFIVLWGWTFLGYWRIIGF